MAIVLASVKGAPLTTEEADGNFTELETQVSPSLSLPQGAQAFTQPKQVHAFNAPKYAAIISYNGYDYIFGGTHTKYDLAGLDTVSTVRYSDALVGSGTALSKSVYGHAAVVVGNMVYISGGVCDTDSTGEVAMMSYNLTTGASTALTSNTNITGRIKHHFMVTDGVDTIYMWGGEFVDTPDTYNMSFETYTISTGTWGTSKAWAYSSYSKYSRTNGLLFASISNDGLYIYFGNTAEGTYVNRLTISDMSVTSVGYLGEWYYAWGDCTCINEYLYVRARAYAGDSKIIKVHLPNASVGRIELPIFSNGAAEATGGYITVDPSTVNDGDTVFCYNYFLEEYQITPSVGSSQTITTLPTDSVVLGEVAGISNTDSTLILPDYNVTYKAIVQSLGKKLSEVVDVTYEIASDVATGNIVDAVAASDTLQSFTHDSTDITVPVASVGVYEITEEVNTLTEYVPDNSSADYLVFALAVNRPFGLRAVERTSGEGRCYILSTGVTSEILDDRTDPLNDGSLLESWTFTDESGTPTYNSRQGGNPWTGVGTTLSLSASSIHNFYDLIIDTPAGYATTGPMSIDGTVSATMMAWLYCDGFTRVTWGELAVKDNLELIGEGDGAGSYSVTVNVDKAAQTATYDAGTQGWHHLAVVYVSSTTTFLIYLDGTYKGTLSNPQNWNQASSIEMDIDTTNGLAKATDIQYFNRNLSQTEVQQLMNRSIHAIANPFPDGTIPQEVIRTGAFPYFDVNTGTGTIQVNTSGDNTALVYASIQSGSITYMSDYWNRVRIDDYIDIILYVQNEAALGTKNITTRYIYQDITNL